VWEERIHRNTQKSDEVFDRLEEANDDKRRKTPHTELYLRCSLEDSLEKK
jgi:hypothetical protein